MLFGSKHTMVASGKPVGTLHGLQSALDADGKEAPMSAEKNIATVRRYYEECTTDDGDPDKKHALAVVDEILSADFTMYFNNESNAEARHGRDKHKEFLVGHTRSFRGERWTVEAIIADEQTVASRWRIQATHTKTGNPIDLRAADFFTIRNGQLAGLRRFLDFRTLMEQTQPKPVQQEASD
jgi:ketosteroid isomerase-like protein